MSFNADFNEECSSTLGLPQMGRIGSVRACFVDLARSCPFGSRLLGSMFLLLDCNILFQLKSIYKIVLVASSYFYYLDNIMLAVVASRCVYHLIVLPAPGGIPLEEAGETITPSVVGLKVLGLGLGLGLGVPIVGLSGSVPLFAVNRLAKRLCLSIRDDLSDMKIVHGGDVVGTFPKGFKIRVLINENCIEEVVLFVRKRLGSSDHKGGLTEALHVFVSSKKDGALLLQLLSSQYPNNCRFVSADNSKDEINQVAAEWGRSVFDILISTSIALVGNENPKCRHLACAGYLFDMMSMVQFFGRLRPYMRSPTGQIFLCVPTELPSRRDTLRLTTLKNDRLMDAKDHSKFVDAMTSKGLQDWLIAASNGTSGCALKKLSSIMGKKRHEDCGACTSCRSSPIVAIQAVAQDRLTAISLEAKACGHVLGRLANECLACGKKECSGIAFGKNIKDSNGQLIVGCMNPRGCWTCGTVGGTPHHKNECFNRNYLKNKACYDCWVWKEVPGHVMHDMGCCPVKARLRRLLSYDYHKTVVDQKATKFQSYFEAIYYSEASFLRFMSEMESKYMSG